MSNQCLPLKKLLELYDDGVSIEKLQKDFKIKRKFKIEEMAELYRDGKTTREIGANFGVSKRPVEIAMKKAGIKFRTESEKKLNWWNKQNAKIRKKFNRRMIIKIKGKKQAHKHRCRIALAKQHNPRLSKYERLIWKKIRKHGFIPQYAIDKFNIDFALPSKKLAVEINGGHFHSSPKKIKQDIAKRKCIEACGWRIESFQILDEKQAGKISSKIASLI